MSDVTIIGFDASSFVRTARLACEEKGVSHDLSMDGIEEGLSALRRPPHSDRHPFGRMPVLRHGDRTVFETSAICQYIDSHFDGPALIPSDRDAKVDCEAWTSAMSYYLDRHIIRDCVLQYVFPSGPDGAPDRARIDAAVPEIRNDLAAVERGLEGRTYLGGDRPIVPDLLLLPMLGYLATVPEGPDLLEAAPNARRFHTAFKSRPSYTATLPERLKQSA